MKKELTLAQKLFKKLSKKERVNIKLKNRKAELEAQASNNILLAEYIDVISKIAEQTKLVKEDEEPLRVAMQEENLTTLEDKEVKVTIKRDYTKSVLNTKLFYETYKPTSKIYQKLIMEQPVKGSIKVTDK